MLKGLLDAAGIRRELKERVDLLVSKQAETNSTLKELVAALRELQASPENVGRLAKLTEAWTQNAARTAEASAKVTDTMQKIAKEL